MLPDSQAHIFSPEAEAENLPLLYWIQLRSLPRLATKMQHPAVASTVMAMTIAVVATPVELSFFLR